MVSKIFRPRNLALLVLLIVLAAMTYGFAASLSVTTMGDVADGSTGPMNDMTISSITWTLDATDPSTDPVAQLTFAAAVNDAYMRVDDDDTWGAGSSGWVHCTADSGSAPDTVWNCDLSGESFSVANLYYVEVAAGE